ncbi:MAG: MiaB/RimO family radical SAM methylthiotransferase [Dehalococcoidia bacterium]|nr:MiaB/RimO family radical SAM methylthiotransferase [Dehalococcoidia bacterium]MDP7240350.1 MiaB/RimO family radical SAM methylthiotransferase [Dehalococcoidia bacterium]
MTRIALHTQGCKLNQAETENLARRLWAAGYQVVNSSRPADAYLLNTCTVTSAADAKARQYLRRTARLQSDALLAATGCYALRSPNELSSITGVRVVAGHDTVSGFMDMLRERGLRPRECSAGTPPLRTRAMVRIQSGCSMGCRYCIVPAVRGKGRSRPHDEVIAEVSQREAEGYQEVVLTGTHIGSYRWGGTDLVGLIGRVMVASKILRIRLTSLQPADLTPQLLSLWRSAGEGRLCSHLHMPLQSGSGVVLREMGRPYTTGAFHRAMSLAREIVPGAAITTDVIVGFPGEGEAEFQESLRFCQEASFSQVHVFPYSPRPGTSAANLPQVDRNTTDRRIRLMLTEAAILARQFEWSQVGQVVPVLWEKEASPGVWSGLASGYLRAFTRSYRPLRGVITPARLEGPAPGGLWATVL